jgi:hypothetical protein
MKICGDWKMFNTAVSWRLGIQLLGLALLAGLSWYLAPLVLTRAAGEPTTIRLDPQPAAVELFQTTSLSVRVENVIDLYGVQVYLDFDPNLLEVVDTDAARDGVNVTLGTFLPHDTLVQNSAEISSDK